MNLFENLQMHKESSVIDENILDDIKDNEYLNNDIMIYEELIKINDTEMHVVLAETEEFINCYINENVLFLQEPKEYVDDLEYFAFNSAVEFYKGINFPNKD